MITGLKVLGKNILKTSRLYPLKYMIEHKKFLTRCPFKIDDNRSVRRLSQKYLFKVRKVLRMVCLRTQQLYNRMNIKRYL